MERSWWAVRSRRSDAPLYGPVIRAAHGSVGCLDQTVAMVDHSMFCPLQEPGWLRHAVAAAGRLVSTDPVVDELRDADRVSAEALTDALAHLAELPGWATVTLADVSSLASEDTRLNCQCETRP